MKIPIFLLVLVLFSFSVSFTGNGNILADNKQSCVTYIGSDSFSLNKCPVGVVRTYRGTHCPTTERLVGEIRDVTSGTYKAIPAAGECEQVDFSAYDGSDGGGQCICYPSQNITCFRCTPEQNDANTCESQVFQNSCPSGWSTNSNCAQAAGGSCAVEQKITCYSCTPQLNDGDTCYPAVYNGNTCPAGTSTNPTGCAAAIGGFCSFQQKTCYRCTDNPDDGDACLAFTINSSICPSGTSDLPNGCASAVGGRCPVCLNNVCPPDTAFTDIITSSSVDNTTGNILILGSLLGILLILNGKILKRLSVKAD